MTFIKRSLSTFKIYRNTKGKTKMDSFTINKKETGPMVLDGLIHISELAKERVKQVSDILNEGDEVLVKCISKERDGKIRLSRKEALDEDIDNYREI